MTTVNQFRSRTPSPPPLVGDVGNPMTKEQIIWLNAVKAHALSGGTEDRLSLKQLALNHPAESNPLIGQVIVLTRSVTLISDLRKLQEAARTALRSINVVSPHGDKSYSPVFFSRHAAKP